MLARQIIASGRQGSKQWVKGERTPLPSLGEQGAEEAMDDDGAAATCRDEEEENEEQEEGAEDLSPSRPEEQPVARGK